MRRVTGAPAANSCAPTAGLSLNPPTQETVHAGGAEDLTRGPAAPSPPIMYHHVPASQGMMGANGPHSHANAGPVLHGNVYASPVYNNYYGPAPGSGFVGGVYPGYPGGAAGGHAMHNYPGPGKYGHYNSGMNGSYSGSPASGPGLVGHAPGATGGPGGVSPALHPASPGGERGGKSFVRRGEGRNVNRGRGDANAVFPPPVDGGNAGFANSRNQGAGKRNEGGVYRAGHSRGNTGRRMERGRGEQAGVGAWGSGDEGDNRDAVDEDANAAVTAQNARGLLAPRQGLQSRNASAPTGEERDGFVQASDTSASLLADDGKKRTEQPRVEPRAEQSPPKEARDDGWDDDGFGGGVSMVDINEIRNKHAQLANKAPSAPRAAAPLPSMGEPKTASQPAGKKDEKKENADGGKGVSGPEKKEASRMQLPSFPAVPQSQEGAAVTESKKEEVKKEEAKKEEPAPVAETSGVSALGKPGGGAWRPRSQRQFTREEELDRTVKALLNKLTIEKFDTITEKLARTVEGLKEHKELQLVVNVVMEKAVTEPDWSEMYADLCQVLQWRSVPTEGTDIDNFRKTPFMKALLTKIQAEYEAMPRTLESRLRSLPSGELDPEAVEEMQQLKRTKNRILGVVKLIGELFQRKILGFPIVRDVVVDLVIKNEEPDEHFIECFVQLIATTGYYIDQNPKMKAVLDSWFGRLTELQKKACYSKRLKCIIQDTLDMRKAEWRKKIHKERAKALSDLREQLETEEVLGGSVHAAQYGNIVVVGQRSNLNGAYAGYLKDQQDTFERKIAKLRPATAPTPGGPGAGVSPYGANPVRR